MIDYLKDDSVDIRAKNIASAQRIKEATMARIKGSPEKSTHKSKRLRTLLIAAAAIMLLSASVFAVRHFTLNDLSGADYEISSEEVSTLLFLNVQGTPEYEAAQEWEAYLNSEFEQGKNMIEPGYVSDEYYMYGAHSDEAKAKLDELLVKYGLKMHKEAGSVNSFGELYSAAGISGFMPDEGENAGAPVRGQLYEDGTFRFNGSAALTDGRNIPYQFSKFTKGFFTRSGNLIAEPENFEEWNYTTSDGVETLLAIGNGKSLVAVDMDTCFIFINVLSGTENSDADKTSYGVETLDKAGLESFAEDFDFDAIESLTF